MAFQTDLSDEAAWRAEIDEVPGTLQVVEVYQNWCGPCKAVAATLKKIFFDYGDRALKFYTANVDKVAVPALEEYKGKSQPYFLLFKDGKCVKKIAGVDAPILTTSILDLSA